MAYKVSGSIQEPMTITVLNSDGIVQDTQTFSAGPWEIDGLLCPSGTIVGFTEDDRYQAFGNVNFIEYDHRPSVPWTNTFSGTLLDTTMWQYWGLSSKWFNCNNVMRSSQDSNNTSNGISSKFVISGDFDVELGYTIILGQNIATWEFMLQIDLPPTGNASEYMARVKRIYDGAHKYVFDGYNTAAFTTNTSATGNTTGKLRIVRSNSTFTGYYWNGSSWTSIASQDLGTTIGTYSAIVHIYTGLTTSNPNTIIQYDYFKVNSGTLNYRFAERFNNSCNYLDVNSDIYKQHANGWQLPYTYNNKLRFDLDYSDLLPSKTIVEKAATLREELVGNFDVAVALTVVAMPSSYNIQFKLQISDATGATNHITIGRWFQQTNGHVIVTESNVGGVYNSYNVATTSTTLMFRIRRSGTSVYTYYKTSQTDYSAWTLHRTINGFTTNNMTMFLSGILADESINTYAVGDFDDLIINNGSNINTKLLVDLPSNTPTVIPEPNTSLLLHFDESTLIDSSYNRYPITANGGVARSATQSKFGGYSLAFDGSNDHLVLPNSMDWYYASDPFTWDFWMKVSNNSTRYMLISNRNTSGPVTTAFEYDGTVDTFFFQQYSGGSSQLRFGANYTLDPATWYHIALVRVNSNDSADGWGIFINGVSQTLTKTNGAWNWSLPNVNSNLYIGSLDGSQVMFGGYMDELRISKGVARWTENFTPPTSAYSA